PVSPREVTVLRQFKLCIILLPLLSLHRVRIVILVNSVRTSEMKELGAAGGQSPRSH
ncbi:hypothetical protein L9F63_003881, partial [Diploptera punctata]